MPALTANDRARKPTALARARRLGIRRPDELPVTRKPLLDCAMTKRTDRQTDDVGNPKPPADRESRTAAQDRREAQQNARDAQQDERDRLQDMLLGVLGHDLRNPLQTITAGAALLVTRGQLDEADERVAKRIVSGANRMERMIDQLLDFTRARVGETFPIEREAMDLGAIVARVISDYETAHPERPFHVIGGRDARGSWDPDRIAQVVGNLIGNANTYAPPGTPITVTTVGEPGDREVSFVVRNEGPAIAPEVLDTMFEPFRRGATAKSNGLGLGLYICKAIVDAHGGRIGVASREGEGTTFEILLTRD